MANSVLVLGASGMLGNACLRVLGHGPDTVFGTIRSDALLHLFPEDLRERLIPGVDALDFESIARAVSDTGPDVIINCIGLVKQLDGAGDPLSALPLNAMLPHQLQRLCKDAGSRLIHISTDCVFSGSTGNYKETDRPDADDLYGVSKRLGELHQPGTVTLRTSIIGHELTSSRSLIDWFLSQDQAVDGFTRAIFSGLPTVELARVIRDHVIPHAGLEGLYHVSAEPISKHDLLRLVAETYGRDIDIRPSERLIIDRSLNSDRFRQATGWSPPPWDTLIRSMHADTIASPHPSLTRTD